MRLSSMAREDSASPRRMAKACNAAGLGFAYEVAGIGAGQSLAMALFGPLADEFSGFGRALEGDDGGNVGGKGGAEEHGSSG